MPTEKMVELNEQNKKKYNWEFPYYEENNGELWWRDQGVSFKIPADEDLAYIYQSGQDADLILKYGEYTRLEVFFPLMKKQLEQEGFNDVAVGMKMIKVPSALYGIMNEIIHGDAELRFASEYAEVADLMLQKEHGSEVISVKQERPDIVVKIVKSNIIKKPVIEGEIKAITKQKKVAPKKKVIDDEGKKIVTPKKTATKKNGIVPAVKPIKEDKKAPVRKKSEG